MMGSALVSCLLKLGWGLRNIGEIRTLPFKDSDSIIELLTLLPALLEGGLLCLLVTDHCEGWKVGKVLVGESGQQRLCE